MHKINLFLILIILSFSYKPSDRGFFKIEYSDKHKKKVDSISTYYDGTVYLNETNRIYKIFPDSKVRFNNQYHELSNGIIFIGFKGKLKIDYGKLDIEKKNYLNNQQGGCQFFRIKFPYSLTVRNSRVRIFYYLENETKTIDTELHRLFRHKESNYYGFFIPFNPYWKIRSYKVKIELSDYNVFYAEIVSHHRVRDRTWETQIVNFRKAATRNVLKQNVEKYKLEQHQRMTIWTKNNPELFFNRGFSYPLLNTEYLTSEFWLIRKWVLYNGSVYSNSIHTGIDYGEKKGKNVYATCSGIVRYAKEVEFLGNAVIIDHGLSLYTTYGHMSEILVKEGMYVNKGDVIGRVGATGAATGPHLHWETKVYGIYVDPRSFLDIGEVLIP